MKSLGAYYYKPDVPDSLKPRSQFGLSEADHIYLCPQAPDKFHPDFDEMLAGILCADPRARLVLIGIKGEYVTALLRHRLERTMQRDMERVTVLPSQTGQDFINLIAVSDVMLDTVHFGGGFTTNLEAFAVGTPVVTLPGEFQRGRHALGFYQEMGFLDCVADSPAHYIELAVRLGMDHTFRETIKQKILARNHVLYESRNVITEYEQFFLTALEASRVQTKKKAVPAGGSKKRRASANQE